MDAVEFIKERVRMCKYYNGCDGCPIQKECLDTEPKQMVNAVEQWSQGHPQKTMMQDFFEKFPNAPKTAKGLPRNICPSDCGYTNEPSDTSVCNKFDGNCLKCWGRPLED